MRMRSLIVALITLCAVPLVAGQNADPRFEVVSVKENTSNDLSIRSEPQPPDGYRQTGLPLASHVVMAFGIPQPSRIANLPEWTKTTRFDISAKASGPITPQQRMMMLRDALATRFKLRSHIEQQEQTIYVMTTVRADQRLGLGMMPRMNCGDEPCSPRGTATQGGVRLQATSLTQFADGMLSSLLRQVVRDETGIPGLFDIAATWRPDTGQVSAADSRPDLFTALREQLGVKLEPQRRPVDVLVIDHIERPSEN
jgi:uncharacterized protein (TIGR03435 family)